MRPKQVSDEQVLKVSKQIFLERGFGVSTEVIANALGISSPALFKRFKSKENLMLMALDHHKMVPWIEEMKLGPDSRPFEVQLKYIVEQMMIFFEEIYPGIMVIRNSGIKHKNPHKKEGDVSPANTVLEISKWLERCHNKGLIKKVDFEFWAVSMMGTINFPMIIKSTQSDKNKKAYSKDFSASFVNNFLQILEIETL